MQIGIWPSFSVETGKKMEIFDAAQKAARCKEVSGELQSSNVRNGQVKTRFFVRPSHSALNTPASKNLGRSNQ